jgi:hypothetical protein
MVSLFDGRLGHYQAAKILDHHSKTPQTCLTVAGQKRKRQGVRGAIRTALACILIFSVAAILVSPDLSDDVDGVLHQHHVRVFHPFFLSGILLHDLLVAWQARVAHANPRKPHMAELFDLFCSRLC